MATIKFHNTFIIFLIFILSVVPACAQRINQKMLHHNELSCRNSNKFHMIDDETYDVKHYHIDLEISLDVEYIEGNVLIVADAVENISFITLDLDSAYDVLSIDGASSFTLSNDELVVTLDSPVLAGEEFTLRVYYQGDPPLAGGYKGLRYETHNGNEPVIVSLSTPYLAHTWWPCNDGTKDKADTVFVDITIDDVQYSGIQVQAISNGILDEVVALPDDKIQYKWKHNYPITPYYVMVAISNYQIIEQLYDNGSESFPLIYYVFDSSIPSATTGVEDIPDVIDFFTNLFGPYPFADEKYGMTQLGFYGGIENQTNTIINNMSESWFMVSVHELAHMWFADMITCLDWHHGWLNEGFASYAEALWVEHSDGINAYHNYVEDFEYYNGGSVYLPDVSDPFNVFQGIIYDKGAYFLHMLRHVLGDSVFFECLQEYSSDPEFQYKWATTEDFREVCEQVSGIDLIIFFDQWIYDAYYPKYQFDYYQDAEFNTEIAILQTQGDNGWREVFQMPVDIKIEFVDGTDTTVVLGNDEVYQSFNFSFTKEIASITFDPDHWILKTATRVDFGLSIGENTLDSRWVIYPNPAQEELNIKLIDVTSSSTDLYILNSQNILVAQVNLENEAFNSYKYDTSKLSSGIYFVKLELEEGSTVKKFLVK